MRSGASRARLAQAEASDPDPRALRPRCVNGGKALVGQQSHGRELHSRKRLFVLRVGHKEGTADVRIEVRALGWTSWKKMISGVFGRSRTRSRMNLARSARSAEKLSMFQDARVNDGLTCFCAILGILGNISHRWVLLLSTPGGRSAGFEF
jgi:hypothetical protein